MRQDRFEDLAEVNLDLADVGFEAGEAFFVSFVVLTNVVMNCQLVICALQPPHFTASRCSMTVSKIAKARLIVCPARHSGQGILMMKNSE